MKKYLTVLVLFVLAVLVVTELAGATSIFASLGNGKTPWARQHDLSATASSSSSSKKAYPAAGVKASVAPTRPEDAPSSVDTAPSRATLKHQAN